MFGFFRPKAERLALKIERLYMVSEINFDKGHHDAALLAMHKMLPSLQKLHHEGWNERKLEAYLRERGLVRSFLDPEYEKRIRAALDKCAYG